MQQHPKPAWFVVVTDVLVIVLALLVFALPHHVIPMEQAGTGIESVRPGGTTATSVTVPQQVNVEEDNSLSDDGYVETDEEIENSEYNPSDFDGLEDPEDTDDFVQNDVESEDGFAVEATEEPVVTPVPNASNDPVGWFGTKFADKFTTGEVISRDGVYQSSNVCITVAAHQKDAVKFYVADIYIKDISCFRTGFAKDKYGKSIHEWPATTAKRIGAVAAINGDYYGVHTAGIVIRNGVLYRAENDSSCDVGVLFWDGRLETYNAGKFDANAAIANGAYQAWSFGPRLLDDNGQPMTSFNSTVNPSNPRTALGYFEPGHYCFVVVDGRSKKSDGLSLINLSKLMAELGCVRAYNLDGGQTSQLVCGGKVVNSPAGGGRQCSDIIGIVDAII